MAASGVIGNDDSASLLVDEWSPPAATPAAAPASSPLRRLRHGGKTKATTRPATTSTRSHDVKRFICSPFAAVFRAMSCARDAAVSTCDEQQPSNKNGTAGVAERERRRPEAMTRRPSLEQLLRMEAPPPASARPADHQQRRKLQVGKPRPREAAAAAPYGAVKEKERRETFPIPSPHQSRHFVADSDKDNDDGARPRTTIVPVKLEAGTGGGPAGRQTNAKRLVVVLASLRACSRAARINDGKAAAAGRAPGKAELFYYRPIPMGRRCRVQHLAESPYGARASSDLSSLLDLGQV